MSKRRDHDAAFRARVALECPTEVVYPFGYDYPVDTSSRHQPPSQQEVVGLRCDWGQSAAPSLLKGRTFGEVLSGKEEVFQRFGLFWVLGHQTWSGEPLNKYCTEVQVTA